MGGLTKQERLRAQRTQEIGYKPDMSRNPGLAEKIADYDRMIEENQKRLDNPGTSSAKTLKRAEENIKNAIEGRKRLLEEMKARDI